MPHLPEAACQQQGPALRGRCPAKGRFPFCRELTQAVEDALPQGQQFQRPGKVASGEIFFPLGSDPLPGHSCRLPGEFLARPEGGLLHPEPQLRGEPGTPQDAQSVLPEPPAGVSHTAQQTGGKIDYLVCALGTSGTLMGLSRFLKAMKPDIKVVCAQPTRGHYIQGLKNMEEAIVPDIYDPSKIDIQEMVESEEAIAMARRIIAREAIFAGMSSGAALLAAVRTAARIERGNIVVVFPDRAE